MLFIFYWAFILHIRQIFRIERTKQKLSQEKFAEIANVHTNYIGKVERGEQNLTIKKLVELTNSLKIPIENIFKT